ncbi:hypothetical protein ACLB2K_035430 [Fragaria x ananassa]
MMKALFAVYSIDVAEDSSELKEHVATLNSHVDFLGVEKKKLERENAALGSKLAKLQLHIQTLEGKANWFPELEGDIESLRRQIEKLHPLEGKLRKKDQEIMDLQAELPRH